MEPTQHYLDHCLFFASNALARAMTRLGEQVFAPTGLSPSHAFALMLVLESPGVTPSELAEKLRLAQSTVTRFIDQLVRRGLVAREAQGRAVRITATPQGVALRPALARCWRKLYEDYSAVLGEEEGARLTKAVRQACRDLGED